MKLGKKRIHIAPVGFEIDRVVIPAVDNKADKVFLLVHNNKKEDKASSYAEQIIKQLKSNKILHPGSVRIYYRDGGSKIALKGDT